ncbi:MULTISPECIES: hypothetical protein [Rhizobium]|uniref:Uncharacterized protein n=1 Tax=Rhizobium miluonense TaxID=411945 RepID=A0A1C3UJQ0_9HYPH|nr:hypothetical protein [Rhizobium miluonense]SCB15649.1 hypothetical protein GA0061102_100462 [Rhizobium miluonense]
MSTSETYRIEYANSALGSEAAAYIFFTVVLVFIAFLSRSNIITSIAWISLALMTAYVAVMALLKLIFQGRKAILIISPEGIKDARLGSDFIPWDDIEKIDVPAPRRSLGMMLGIILLGLCLLVIAIILSEGALFSADTLDWSRPDHHVWLLLAPGRRITGQLRGAKRSIRQVAGDMQHVGIAVSDLTYEKPGLLELIVKFHARYKKVEKTE